NAQVSAGALGAAPATQDSGLNAIITAQSRLTTADQFKNIIVKNDPNRTPVRLSDGARVELGAESYGNLAHVNGHLASGMAGNLSKLNGHLASGMAVNLAPGANALKTADSVKAMVADMAKDFPPGVTYAVANDSTQFVKIAIEDVVKTLVEAIALVFLVMFLFL